MKRQNKEIRLNEAEQLYLKDFVKNGSHKANEITRARVLLMLDRTGKSDHVRYNRTAEYAGISGAGAAVLCTCEAKIITLACSKAPEGHSRWTLRLLSEKAVELNIIESISHVRVHQIFKKQNINLT